MTIAAKARLAFDFDRAASIMAALSAKPVSPRELNPYRSNHKRAEYSVDDIERAYRVHKAGGRLIEQTITMAQVVNDA